MRHIFVAHVEEDADVALEVALGLEEAGYTTWLYELDSVPGISYLLQTGQAIDQAQAIVLVISPHSLASHQVSREVVRAYEGAKNFIPLLRDVTHTEFQARQPEWREALGAAASISITEEGLASVMVSILDRLKALGIPPKPEIDAKRVDRIRSRLGKLQRRGMREAAEGARPAKMVKRAALRKPIKGKVSNWWWLLPVLLVFIGGIISWASNSGANRRKATNMLVFGILFTAIWLVPLFVFYIPMDCTPPIPTPTPTPTTIPTPTPTQIPTPTPTPTPMPTPAWSKMSSVTTKTLYGVWGTSSSDVFAVGDEGRILHYDGSDWSKMSSVTTETLRGVWGTYHSDVFAVGDVILHYDGSAWSEMDSGHTEVYFFGVWGSSSDDVFAVGDCDIILHYNGTGWSEMSGGTGYPLNAVWGTSHDDVFAVGDRNDILHYNGSDWSEMSSGTSESIRGVWGTSSSDVFAVGTGGTILHYDGSAWNEMDSGTTEWFEGVWGTSSSDVFAVGRDGTILHYSD